MATICTVQAKSIDKIITAAAAAGVAPVELYRAAQLELAPAVIAEPDRRIPFAQLVALFEHAALLTGDADFGLHLSERVQLQVFDIFGYTILHSPNLGEAWRRMTRYYRLWTDGSAFRLEEDGQWVRLSYLLLDAQVKTYRQDCEFSLALVANQPRLITGVDLAPHKVSFQHHSPASTTEHRRLFRAPVFFGQSVNEVIFARAAMELPLSNADPGLGAVLDRYANELLAKYPRHDGATDRLRRLLSEALRGGDPSLAAMAKQMQMSARTLQRKLKEEGTSYQLLLDEMRHELSMRYLLEPGITIGEVAYLLGFSETATFHRAFRRWQGMPPGEYQRTMR